MDFAFVCLCWRTPVNGIQQVETLPLELTNSRIGALCFSAVALFSAHDGDQVFQVVDTS